MDRCATAGRRLLFRCFCVVAVGLLWAQVAAAGEAIFGEDFECGTIGAWSNGGVGDACLGDLDCLTGHCQNGYCCESGDCCASAADCTAYMSDPVCDDEATCQGSRMDAACNCRRECASEPVDDDSDCTSGVQALGCSPYLPVFCDGGSNQSAPSCPTSCAADGDCVGSAHCDGTCIADLDLGDACDEGSDCGSTLCVDDLCCSAACSGVCEACDVASSQGACSAIPAGADPDSECGAVSCAAYFWGWTGDVCYRKADVSAGSATCNGSRACKSTAVECSASGQGSAAVTCHADCQEPNLGTCTGTTSGACTNVNPGNQTCGEGVCEVTVAQCAGGAPNLCVPNSGAATTETCNNLDDNCDGTVDNGAFADGQEANGSCGAVKVLATVGSDETETYSTLTLYPAGDVDYFQISASETDSVCGCGALSTDEDYDLTITLEVPAGSGSYRLCVPNAAGAGECANAGQNCKEVVAGGEGSTTFQLDGSCAGADAYTVFVRVTGLAAPGFECAPYRLSYTFDAGLCR